jgi:diguanylate cyclase (GGDEF)-like protein
VVLAFTLIGLATRLGLAPTRAHGVLFVAVFAWLGLRHPPRSSLKVFPLFVPAYVIPLIGANPPLDPRALLIASATCVFVAEKIAAAQRRSSDAGAAADRSAAAFRAVATASALLQRLEPEAVLDAVVDGVMALGYDGANLVVIDDAEGTFSLIHPRGLSIELGTAPHPIGAGMTALVRDSRRPLVIQDYARWEHAIEHYRHSGVRSLIGVPVLAGDRLVGVLVASTRSPRPISTADVEPLQALAEVAGAALVNVGRFQAERSVAAEQTLAALTDGLTGLSNRRHADEVLVTLGPGTCLVMIDVDRFHAVNERLGHAGGDAVLRAIARHFSARLRDQDFLARFGGEELLLLLPGLDLGAALAVVERLASSWRATNPEATFSAGIALHLGGDVGPTLERADAALYEAKHSGRDRCFTEQRAASVRGGGPRAQEPRARSREGHAAAAAS